MFDFSWILILVIFGLISMFTSQIKKSDHREDPEVPESEPARPVVSEYHPSEDVRREQERLRENIRSKNRQRHASSGHTDRPDRRPIETDAKKAYTPKEQKPVAEMAVPVERRVETPYEREIIKPYEREVEAPYEREVKTPYERHTNTPYARPEVKLDRANHRKQGSPFAHLTKKQLKEGMVIAEILNKSPRAKRPHPAVTQYRRMKS